MPVNLLVLQKFSVSGISVLLNPRQPAKTQQQANDYPVSHGIMLLCANHLDEVCGLSGCPTGVSGPKHKA